jgi:hypothetical protein
MMDDIDGAADEEKDLKSDLKKDVFRRKAQLTQVTKKVSATFLYETFHLVKIIFK